MRHLTRYVVVYAAVADQLFACAQIQEQIDQIRFECAALRAAQAFTKKTQSAESQTETESDATPLFALAIDATPSLIHVGPLMTDDGTPVTSPVVEAAPYSGSFNEREKLL
eukprot:TRINITY_DN5403_c0_g2_i1.p1 TRINITY_DN5403_c0_g2~~TRINITY_DN5403_c0_g2_i1.p1  ORF type:complete len:111 (-),score=30.31 TRINITY_DN5403_c0_g2_i1:59-391(-)